MENVYNELGGNRLNHVDAVQQGGACQPAWWMPSEWLVGVRQRMDLQGQLELEAGLRII